MHFNFQKHQSKQLIQDYISWRLYKHGYPQWNILNKIDLSKNSKLKTCLLMRQLAYEFEKQFEKYYNSFTFQFESTETSLRDILNTLLIDLFELDSENVIILENESKSDSCINFNLSTRDSNCFKCNWSKLIALFAFSGNLACRLYELKASNLIYTLTELLTELINNEKRIFSWISCQGSWNDGLNEYYNERRTYFKFSPSEFNLYEGNEPDESLKNIFSNFTNNSCISRPPSPTLTLISRSLSDSALNRSASPSYLTSIQNQFKNTFFKLSQYAAVGVGSIGVLILGAVYMKRKF